MAGFNDYKRGDIVQVDFDKIIQAHGNHSVQKGIRPAVVIQNNVGNLYSDNLIVAAVTSQIKKETQPTHVIFKDPSLKESSMVMLEQIHTISKKSVQRKLGALDQTTISQIDKAYALSIGVNLTLESCKNNISDIKKTKESVDDMKNKRLTKDKMVEIYIDMMEGMKQKQIVEKYDINEHHFYNYKALMKKGTSNTFLEAKNLYELKHGIKTISETAPTVQQVEKKDHISTLNETVEKTNEFAVAEKNTPVFNTNYFKRINLVLQGKAGIYTIVDNHITIKLATCEIELDRESLIAFSKDIFALKDMI